MKALFKVILLMPLLFTLSATYAADVANLIQTPLPQLSENQETQLLDISYKPGEGSEIHRHNAYVYLYVLEGEVEMQIQGGKLYTLSAGETFTEIPEDIHIVSRNASSTEEARFLVFLIRTEGTPLSMPVEL